MKKFILIFLFCLLSIVPARAYYVETEWRIVDFVGSLIGRNAHNLIGEIQSIVKYNIKGPFYNCQKGMWWTYNRYTTEELFANPEFHLLKDLNDKLNLDDDMYFVHRLTCNGVAEGDVIMNFYPFITTHSQKVAYFIMDGGVFIFEDTKH